MNLYQKEIYSSYLEHGERRDHKYLYKIGDRYIYPDDVAKGAKNIYTQGQANNVNIRKARVESTAAGNKRLAENIRKAGKASKEKWDNGGNDTAKKVVDFLMPSTFRAIKNNSGQAVKYLKEDTKNKKKDDLPPGYVRHIDGLIYDDRGVRVSEEYIEKLKKQNKGKSIAKK